MAWAPDYITEAELRAYVRLTDSVDDVFLADAAAAASRAIDRHCGRQFGKVDAPEQRTYEARWDRHWARGRGAWVVVVDDLMTTVGLAVEVAGVAVTGYVLEPRNNVALGKPWELLVIPTSSAVQPACDGDDVDIVAPWGWSAVPRTVKTAAKLQGNRVLSRRDSPHGIAGSPDAGGELRLLARVDADLKPMLSSFVRHWAAA